MENVMNKQRRKQISDNVKLLEHIKSNIESILSDEENYFDNIPENLQCSIRGENSEEAIEILNEVIESLEDCIEKLNELI